MVAFSIWSLHIYRYGILYLIGFIFWYLGFKYIARRRFFATKYPWIQTILEKHLEDLLIIIFLGVVLGGRLGHVIIYSLPYYLAHPGEIVRFRDGGMSFIGGLFGVIIGVLSFWKRKKWTSRDLLVLFDIFLILLPIGIALGRVGNYLNQELYGIIATGWLPRLGYPLFSLLNDLNILHVYPTVDEFLRVNTNFLSIFFEWIVVFVIGLFVFRSQMRHKLWRPWMRSAVFLMIYSFVRFRLEYLRADSQMEFRGRFTISQRFFIAFFIAGAIIFYLSLRPWKRKS